MRAPTFRIVHPAPVLLSAFSGPQRLPVRPPALRGEGFEAAFDDDTLFYDVFRVPGSGKVLALGPALFNLADGLRAARVRAIPWGETCPFEVHEFDRHVRVVISAPPAASSLSFEGPLGAFEMEIQDSFADALAGARLLTAKSRDNSLEWIQDWIRYHRDLHGVDAVLIHDNHSTVYDIETLMGALSAVQGLRAAIVVDWPFKFGPQGTFEGLWDSDFCEYGALEHARWRFAPRVQGVINADIDELLVSSSGRSVFDALARSRLGIVRYPGRWVVGVEGDPVHAGRLRRHSDYHIALKPEYQRRFFVLQRDRLRCPPKWTVDPSRCPARAQWKSHGVARWLPGRVLSPGFLYRHFREIGTNWKYERTTREPFQPSRHFDDAELRAAFSAVDWVR